MLLFQATGPQLGLLIAGVVTVIGGLIVSLTASWQLALLMMAFIPLLVGCGMFMNAFFGATKDSAANRGGKVTWKYFENRKWLAWLANSSKGSTHHLNDTVRFEELVMKRQIPLIAAYASGNIRYLHWSRL